MQTGQTPYQRMMPPPARSQTAQANADMQPPPRQTPPPPVSVKRAQPTTTKKMASMPELAGSRASSRGAGKSSVKWMLMVTLAFFIFFLLIIGSKLANENNTNKKTAHNEHTIHLQNNARHIATILDNNIAWINNGLGEGKNPAQAVYLIAKSPQIASALILNGQNKIIARSQNTMESLSNVSLKGISQNAIKVTSLINKDGNITPVIIKKTGNYYAVAALANHVLLQTTSEHSNFKTALITSSGRIIDGDSGMGKTGTLEWFGLSATQLERITSAENATLEKLKAKKGSYRLSSVQIANSNATLSLMQARPTPNFNLLQNNFKLFGLLFFGTCLFVGILLNSLYKQLSSAQHHQLQTEISQQRYQAAVEGDRGGIWELDLPSNSAYLSASLSSLLGMPRQEHTISIPQFLALFHPQERDRFLSVARRAHVQGEFDINVSAAHLPLILQCRGRPSTRTDRDFKRLIVGVAVDITAQRRAQAQLKSTEERLHNALSSMSDSFAVWDNAKRLVLWNVKFADFFGFADGGLHQGIDHASVEFAAQSVIAQTTQNSKHAGWSEIKLKDDRWLRYIETPIANGGHVSIGTEITEIRMRETQLRDNEITLQHTVDVLRKSQGSILELAERYEQEKIRAEDANQSKTDFLASMSHELRTPLNAINGFSDIMKKEMFGPLGDPRYKEYIGDILFSGQHLLALINDILDMSKIEAGKMTLNTEIIFMHEMVEQVVRIIRGRAEEAQLSLDIKSVPVHEIEADPRAVKQILLNLVTNAIKFTPENGTVGIEIIEKKTGLIIKITDSGIGISKDNIERLAKPFEQVEDNGHKHKEGTGLGLALSKSLIELHGGTFKIESVLGSGTTVIFSLPNKPIEQKADNKDNVDVRQEISKLAKDIADVLEEETVQKATLQQAEKQYSVVPEEPIPAKTVSAATATPPPMPNPHAA